MDTKQESKIRTHGDNLLRIFPDATERDPMKLCKKLRRLEAQASALALRTCNGPQWDTEDECEDAFEAVRDKVDALLKFRDAGVPVFINRDPRGYALKISSEWTQKHNVQIERDWGGYGIIAPEIKP